MRLMWRAAGLGNSLHVLYTGLHKFSMLLSLPRPAYEVIKDLETIRHVRKELSHHERRDRDATYFFSTDCSSKKV
jgi:hypothetical protein